ncbi:MAG: MFS transporter [Bacilli bacterium]|nr:MFS transporter [Bacilli bacterium]
MENSKEKLKGKTWLAIVIISLVGQVAWAIENNFFNLFIRDVFNANLNQIALMVSLSAVAATITTLLIGALSDKIGKRKIFICLGYILWGVTIIIFALMQKWAEHLSILMGISSASIGVSLVIIFDCIMTFFGSSANDACYNAWLTDISDDSNRGKVEGINSAMPLVAMLMVFGGAMFLSREVDGKTTYDYNILFLIIGIAVILIGVLSFFIVDESKVKGQQEEKYLKKIFYGFRPSVIKTNKILYLVLLTFCLFNISTQVFMPYFVIYLNILLHENYVLIMAPAIVLGAVFTVLYGKVIDKFGYLKSLPITFGLYIIGLITLSVFKITAFVFIGSLLMLCGFLGSNAVFGAMIREKTPTDEAGSFQGIRIIVQVLIPMLIGPWIGSLVSSGGDDFGFGVVGDSYTPSQFIFLAGAVVSLLLVIPYYFTCKSLKNNPNP